MSAAERLQVFDVRVNGYDLQVRAMSIGHATSIIQRTLPKSDVDWKSLRLAPENFEEAA